MTRVIRKRPFYGTTSPKVQEYEKQHRKLAREAAVEGIVLLKNENQVLPLDKQTNIALYGAGASRMIKGGTGSGDVNERDVVNIYQGLINAGYEITTKAWIEQYDEIYMNARYIWRDKILAKVEGEGKDGVEFFNAYASTPFFMPDEPEVADTDADTAIYVLSRVAGEGADRFNAEGDYYLTEKEQKNIEIICRFYEKVIVVINAGGLVDLSFADEYDNIYTIIHLVQPGMEGGNALADIISGKRSPSGKLADTWAKNYDDYPNSKTFSHNNGDVYKEKYEEGIYIGYRYFDSFRVPVKYSFGYGLSYTAFEIKTKEIAVVDTEIIVSVKVKNIGKVYSGKEVVQVYVTAPVGTVEKEYRKLCGFEKTKELSPGECEIIKIHFPIYKMASYDDKTAAWILDAGYYGIWIGNYLKDSTLEAMLNLNDKAILVKTENICPLKDKLAEISVPKEERIARYEALVQEGKKKSVLEVNIDAGEIKTEVIDYSRPYTVLDDEAEKIVNGLSMEQLIELATGDPKKGQGGNLGASGLSVAGSAGETSACAYDEGIANIVLADGPAGLRLNQTYSVVDGKMKLPPMEANFEHGFLWKKQKYEGEKYYQYCTAFPVGTLLAQTWNKELIYEIGVAVAEEMERFGVTLWLAPGMNIHRNPLCGRNFEYYSEDPILSGEIASAMTNGVQSIPGCGTTIKHFACNNQEDNRMGSDSIISERALREIYLKGFEVAIKESRPMAIMTSYNLINGIHAANCYDTCTKAARQEWGFDGVIMTDWCTTEQGEDCTASGCMRAGNDLVMPGQFSDHENIRKELEQGTLKVEELKQCVTRLVRVILRSSIYEG